MELRPQGARPASRRCSQRVMAGQHLSHNFSSCFASAESPWTAEPHGVEWNEPLLADCEYGWLVTDVMRGMGLEAGLNTQVAFWSNGKKESGLPAGPVTG